MVTLGIVVCSCQLGGPKIVDTTNLDEETTANFHCDIQTTQRQSDVHSDVFSTSQ